MIIVAPLLVLATSILGDARGVDCKVGEDFSFTNKYVANRIVARLKPSFIDNRQALKSALEKQFKTELEMKTLSSGLLVFDSASIKLPSRLHFDKNLPYQPYADLERDPYIFAHGMVGGNDAYPPLEPNDEYFKATETPLWGLVDIGAPAAWAHSTGTTEVVVAVVDGGIYFDHDDLEASWTLRKQVDACPPGADGYDAILDQCQITVNGSHGTRMAGAIGAVGDNKIGVVGVNWSVGLLSVTFMKDGIGCASAAANALRFVRRVKEEDAANVRVVNLSWGSSTDSEAIRKELQLLSNAGVVLVASAGNYSEDIDDSSTPMYPAIYPLDTLIAVAFSTQKRKLDRGSNFGKRSVHIAAPGRIVYTTYTKNESHYDDDSGSSIAAAYVSGAVALLASSCACLSGKELKELLLKCAERRSSLEGMVENARALRIDRAMAECVTRCSR